MRRRAAPPSSHVPPRRARGEVSIALLVSVALTAVVTAVLAAFAVYFYQSEKAQRWDELRRGLAASADELAAAVSLSVWNFDEAQIVTIMKSGLSNRRLHASMVTPVGGAHPYILLRNEEGLLVGSPVAPQDAGLLVERRQMMVEGQRIGSITLYASPEALLGELRQRATGIVGMIVVLDLVLVAGLYAVLWHLMLKPVQAIGRYAADVEAGLNPGAQPPRAWFFGELKRLYATIREMVALLDQRYQAIQANEQRLRIATRAAGIGIWDWNIQTGVAEWDDQMFRLYGATRAGVASPLQLWLDQLHPEDAERAQASLRRALEGAGDMADEFRIVWPDGSVHHIQVDAMLFRDAAGQPARMVGVNYDITAHKLAQQELRRHRHHLEDLVADRTEALSVAVTQAQAANRAKSVFLANMSHELRTPLHSVIGFSRLMADAGHMLPEERRNLGIIHGSGQHLLALINDILELSRIEAGRSRLQPEPLPLPEMLQEVVDMVSIRARQAGLALRLDCQDLPARVLIDGTKLRQVLLNLMSNAVKFSSDGLVTLRARAEHVHGDGDGGGPGGWRLAFAVIDTGPGIAPADQQRIFEPFVQAGADPHSGAREGTGLGLAISREFVQLMGGTLTVESAPGEGAAFRFTVPARPLAADREAHASRAAPAGGAAHGGAPPPPLTAAQLERLPAALRVPLHEAVRQLNLAQVAALLAALPPELADVVAGIEAMLAQHAYPQLCALLQERGRNVKEQA
ncbi:sensor histidine kinase [Pseudoduganella namucuonensis]|uniref:Virulence sensor protein BvgS n=1 Tax=Pseudoduganella namucuonensis TaxID=1035707 RepID=A0A1I7GU45_9BURK|nr:ATP-binding protein [Pseudoduganella namucuonensis]SFU51988.1 PAS domain S-box-containing protein [Pseudoduganella namucuonensis]